MTNATSKNLLSTCSKTTSRVRKAYPFPIGNRAKLPLGKARLSSIFAALAVVLLPAFSGTAHASCEVSYEMFAASNPAFQVPASNLPTPLAAGKLQGLFHTQQEVDFWKKRIVSGPFLHNGDFTRGSPGDWDRIVKNANDFVANPALEPNVTAVETDTSAPGFKNLSASGFKARDAAFAYLLTGDARYLGAAKSWLLRVVGTPANDVSTLCFKYPSVSIADAYFVQAAWVARAQMVYDFLKYGLTIDERRTVESAFRKWAYFFAAHIQWTLAAILPNRMSGDYSVRKGPAAYSPSQDLAWAKKRIDTNGDCNVDDADATTQFGVYTHVNADGSLGNRVSVLSQYYNNRRAQQVMSFGLTGVLLHDRFLITEAKRYVTEWLAAGVWSDGTQGEYLRNGDYCIPQQGVIYGASNIQTGVMLADALARTGDVDLYVFETGDGMFGTESATNAPRKSVLKAMKTCR